ncbi:formate/nitrite transporter family protein [Streptomyces sp. NPDC059564]|uniref:formate/nitrite transporter family protein n=1 Tax=Streptomyces sp. NPDC059564 TaxID=3346865 RepID=UPI00367B57EE
MGGESTEPGRGSQVLGVGGRGPRTRPTAKIFVLWPPVAGFVAVGFEHCVANVALFSLAILDGPVGFRDLFRNPMCTVPGNTVGGGLLVGALYWFTGGARRECGAMPSD